MGIVKIGSARIDERGKITGGVAGDSTGNEVSYQNWYLHSKGWIVIRAKDSTVRKKIAQAMRSACSNNNIGYDQSNRNGLYNNIKTKGFDPAKCTVKTETDCSALVRVCVCFALAKSIPDFNTSGEKNVLNNLGVFDILTDSKYTTKSDYLLEGDILVTKTKGHTIVILNDGSKVNSSNNIISSTLNKGDKGSEVRELQENLNTIINVGLKVDGDFGDKTEFAVIKFQARYGLSVDGVYGPKSHAMMINVLDGKATPKTYKVATYTLRIGSKGSNVRTLQNNLNVVINAGLKVDGDFGADTKSAVSIFQNKFDLDVDGVYGKDSYNKMKSILV